MKPDNLDFQGHVTTRELARRLGVSVGAINNWRSLGTLPHTEFGFADGERGVYYAMPEPRQWCGINFWREATVERLVAMKRAHESRRRRAKA